MERSGEYETSGQGPAAPRPRAGGGASSQMSSGERWFNHLSFLFVGLSGVAYGIMKYLMEADPESFSVVNHPWQPAALDVHVLTAPLLVFAIGMLARDHILARWRNRDFVKSRRTGILLAVGVLPMVLSGYLLQTVTGEMSLKALVVIHVVSSSVFFLGYVAHGFLALAARRRREQRVIQASRERLLDSIAAARSPVSSERSAVDYQ